MQKMPPTDRQSSFSEQFADIAMVHVGLWNTAFMKQLDRLCVEEARTSEEILMDFVFLVIALHNFRLSLKRWRDELEGKIGRGRGVRDRRQAASWASNAVEAFEQDLPQVTALRNVFSHFEDYAYGSGRLQKKSSGPINVLSNDARVFVVKDADNHFEFDLDTARATMDYVRHCVVEVLLYQD